MHQNEGVERPTHAIPRIQSSRSDGVERAPDTISNSASSIHRAFAETPKQTATRQLKALVKLLKENPSLLDDKEIQDLEHELHTTVKGSYDDDSSRDQDPLALAPRLSSSSSISQFQRGGLTSRLGIAYLYSNPIVCENSEAKGGFDPYQTFLSHIPEAKNLIRAIKDRNNECKNENPVSLRVDVATSEGSFNLGGYRLKTGHQKSTGQEFCLAFEKNHGCVDFFDVNRLRSILSMQDKKEKSREQKPDLVVVSACNSFEAGRVFRDAGVPYVIAVHSGSKVLDDACKAFSKTLYQSLLNNASVPEAFAHAQTALRDRAISGGLTNNRKSSGLHTCCCSHQHRYNCPFLLIKKDKGRYMTDAEIHCAYCVPHDASCFCARATEGSGDAALHVENCSWARWRAKEMGDVTMTLQLEDDEHEEEKEKEKKKKMMKKKRRVAIRSHIHFICLEPGVYDGRTLVISGKDVLRDSSDGEEKGRGNIIQEHPEKWVREKLGLGRGPEITVRYVPADPRYVEGDRALEPYILVEFAHRDTADNFLDDHRRAASSRSFVVSKMRVCCCAPHLSHNESSKFTLLTGIEEYSWYALAGVGRSIFARQASQYLYERDNSIQHTLEIDISGLFESVLSTATSSTTTTSTSTSATAATTTTAATRMISAATIATTAAHGSSSSLSLSSSSNEATPRAINNNNNNNNNNSSSSSSDDDRYDDGIEPAFQERIRSLLLREIVKSLGFQATEDMDLMHEISKSVSYIAVLTNIDGGGQGGEGADVDARRNDHAHMTSLLLEVLKNLSHAHDGFENRKVCFIITAHKSCRSLLRKHGVTTIMTLGTLNPSSMQELAEMIPTSSTNYMEKKCMNMALRDKAILRYLDGLPTRLYKIMHMLRIELGKTPDDVDCDENATISAVKAALKLLPRKRGGDDRKNNEVGGIERSSRDGDGKDKLQQPNAPHVADIDRRNFGANLSQQTEDGFSLGQRSAEPLYVNSLNRRIITLSPTSKATIVDLLISSNPWHFKILAMLSHFEKGGLLSLDLDFLWPQYELQLAGEDTKSVERPPWRELVKGLEGATSEWEDDPHARIISVRRPFENTPMADVHHFAIRESLAAYIQGYLHENKLTDAGVWLLILRYLERVGVSLVRVLKPIGSQHLACFHFGDKTGQEEEEEEEEGRLSGEERSPGDDDKEALRHRHQHQQLQFRRWYAQREACRYHVARRHDHFVKYIANTIHENIFKRNVGFILRAKGDDDNVRRNAIESFGQLFVQYVLLNANDPGQVCLWLRSVPLCQAMGLRELAMIKMILADLCLTQISKTAAGHSSSSSSVMMAHSASIGATKANQWYAETLAMLKEKKKQTNTNNSSSSSSHYYHGMMSQQAISCSKAQILMKMGYSCTKSLDYEAAQKHYKNARDMLEELIRQGKREVNRLESQQKEQKEKKLHDIQEEKKEGKRQSLTGKHAASFRHTSSAQCPPPPHQPVARASPTQNDAAAVSTSGSDVWKLFLPRLQSMLGEAYKQIGVLCLAEAQKKVQERKLLSAESWKKTAQTAHSSLHLALSTFHRLKVNASQQQSGCYQHLARYYLLLGDYPTARKMAHRALNLAAPESSVSVLEGPRIRTLISTIDLACESKTRRVRLVLFLYACPLLAPKTTTMGDHRGGKHGENGETDEKLKRVQSSRHSFAISDGVMEHPYTAVEAEREGIWSRLAKLPDEFQPQFYQAIATRHEVGAAAAEGCAILHLSCHVTKIASKDKRGSGNEGGGGAENSGSKVGSRYVFVLEREMKSPKNLHQSLVELGRFEGTNDTTDVEELAVLLIAGDKQHILGSRWRVGFKVLLLSVSSSSSSTTATCGNEESTSGKEEKEVVDEEKSERDDDKNSSDDEDHNRGRDAAQMSPPPLVDFKSIFQTLLTKLYGNNGKSLAADLHCVGLQVHPERFSKRADTFRRIFVEQFYAGPSCLPKRKEHVSASLSPTPLSSSNGKKKKKKRKKKKGSDEADFESSNGSSGGGDDIFMHSAISTIGFSDWRRNKVPKGCSFIGRRKEMAATVDALVKSRVVWLKGSAHGVGTSSVAASTALFLRQRKVFPDGIVVIDARGVQEEETLESVMINALRTLIVPHKPYNAVDDHSTNIAKYLRRLQILIVLEHVEGLLMHKPMKLLYFIKGLAKEAVHMCMILTSHEIDATSGGGRRESSNRARVLQGIRKVDIGPLKHNDAARLYGVHNGGYTDDVGEEEEEDKWGRGQDKLASSQAARYCYRLKYIPLSIVEAARIAEKKYDLTQWNYILAEVQRRGRWYHGERAGSGDAPISIQRGRTSNYSCYGFDDDDDDDDEKAKNYSLDDRSWSVGRSSKSKLRSRHSASSDDIVSTFQTSPSSSLVPSGNVGEAGRRAKGEGGGVCCIIPTACLCRASEISVGNSDAADIFGPAPGGLIE
eukprot:jgi/Bigna1/80574/fgenesh1_pg.72_\